MKPVKFVILAMLCFISTFVYPQGTSCNSPHTLILDTVSRNYSTSSSTGNSAHCTASEFSGTGKITVFSFTTDASGTCVLVHFSTSPAVASEMALYTGCSGGGGCQGIQSSSTLCFSDGSGYWAPSETFTLAPNTTYFLRVWTATATTITIAARNYSPPNNYCSGATYIGPDAINDNNACNKGSTEIFPVQLCAFSLENTAFYTYIVENTGVSSIQLNDINCDNSDVGNNNGFQIGFFIGACGSLIKINCTTLAGGSLSAPTGSLTAGTQVWVAVDGSLGSNCSYTISAFNASILPVTLKYFTAWKRPEANRLTWLTMGEQNFSHFVIEKSIDGVNFVEIGTRGGRGNSHVETTYTFDDTEIKPLQFYRLKYINFGEKSTYSNIIRVNRDDVANTKVIFNNRITNQLALRIIDLPANNLSIKIIDNSGRQLKSHDVKVVPGENSFNLNTGSMPSGFYYMILSAENYKRTFSFVKS
jgi:hypothetical protein